MKHARDCMKTQVRIVWTKKRTFCLDYIAWKDRMEAVLDENGLKELIYAEIPILASSDAATFDTWKKKTTKCRRILLEGVKDHIVSSLHGKDSPFLMWKALTDLFQSKSDQRKLDRKSTRLNSSHLTASRMPSSA